MKQLVVNLFCLQFGVGQAVCSGFIRAYLRLMRAATVNQNSKVVSFKNKNNELKDAKTLHRAEGD